LSAFGVDPARLLHEGRCTEVGQSADDGLTTEAGKAISLGRSTIIEHAFLQNLFTSLTSSAKAVDDINANISAMDKASLQQTDINPELWKFVSGVLQGQKLSAM